MSENSKGVLLFAQNNSKINYLGLAILCAKCVKNNLGQDTKISVVTDQYSLNWGNNKSLSSDLFDQIIFDSGDKSPENLRLYRDTQYHTVTDNFKNSSRSNAYDLSPYDETLLIDVDYFILNDNLNSVWNNTEDFLINKSAKSLLHKPLEGNEFRLNPFGIRMYWATLIYFKKTSKAKLVFSLVEHIKECWDYYCYVYDFPSGLYRNDYAFSIAIHMLSGYSDNDSYVKSFPIPEILTALDLDQFIEFENKNTIKFYVNDPMQQHKFYISKIKNVNVHCMNKISILNKLEQSLKSIS